MDDASVLDAYSRTVVAVAESVLPSVASISVRTARGGGAGSATVVAGGGVLLTSAHVVVGAASADAAFPDGTTTVVDVVG
ncbi:MAG: peptidase S1, partial [Amnibacterium sp.]